MEKNEKEDRLQALQEELKRAYSEIETLKKLPQTAFFESAHQWRMIFDAFPEAICLVDDELRIIRCNASMANTLGKVFQEIIGKNLDQFDIDKKILEVIKKLLPEVKKNVMKQSATININNLYYEITIHPVIDESGKDIKALLVIRDITHFKNMEKGLMESHSKLKQTLHGIVGALATTIEKRDPFTAGHERRVAQIAQAIATYLGLEPEKIEGILISGLLHDVGKIVVPSEILSKPGRLNAHEYNIVKIHPSAGYDILRKIEFPWPVPETVLQHHERLNGTGYPKGINREQIILEARILAVADVFEAMLSFRPYRNAKTLNQAILELLELKGHLFDEKIVDACVEIFQKKIFNIELN